VTVARVSRRVVLQRAGVGRCSIGLVVAGRCGVCEEVHWVLGAFIGAASDQDARGEDGSRLNCKTAAGEKAAPEGRGGSGAGGGRSCFCWAMRENGLRERVGQAASECLALSALRAGESGAVGAIAQVHAQGSLLGER
jgi:hypothetical protein